MKLFVNIVIMFMACLSSGAEAAEVSIQAEYYIDSYNIDIDEIRPYGTELLGLSCAGEWTEYNYSISSFGTRSAVMYARGPEAMNYHLRLTLTPAGGGDPVSVDFQFTGSGCG
ncbi:MAG: hypothetical protein R6U43_02830 [Candidatus Krumholzibacteriales bacterium]